uniref:G_PROTEIN_RECEP_F1_2 domain-containing protein n=1 Tax=Heterorhabditis bacteriophora TaxID=37862 RepID=A0A1I7WK43_HETBA
MLILIGIAYNYEFVWASFGASVKKSITKPRRNYNISVCKMSEKGDGQVFVVDNRPRDDLIKTILIIVLIIVFPPAAVAVQANECNVHVVISLFLMFFFVIPAYIHGVWFCFFRKAPEHVIA